MNLAYKHLNARLKIGEFTVGQWAVVFAGLLVTLLWGFYLSPFGPYVSVITAVYFGGLPISLAFVASFAEFNLWRFGRAAWKWGLAQGRYTPGAGSTAKGYVITPDPRARHAATRAGNGQPDLSTLWG
jgi:hypothetical protein